METYKNQELEQGMERYNSPENPYKIVPGLMVHPKSNENGGTSGKHFGTVDHMEGEDYIRLSRSDSFDGEHHWIPLSWVKNVDENSVFLNVTEKEFYDELLDECPYNNKKVS